MKKIVFLVAICTFFFNTALFADSAKKVLYIASYHTEKGEWTAGIKAGIDTVLSKRGDVALEVFNMDTRLSRSPEEKEAAAAKAHERIQSLQPDLVITSDDNAAKYLIAPYYKNAALPFVFCGLNWDASVYGLPYSNTTGMIEVQLISQIIEHLETFSNGHRIGILRGDTLSNRKEQEHFEAHTGRRFDVRYVHNFSQWEKEFVQLQTHNDMVIFGSLGAVDMGKNTMGDVKAFVMANTRVPTGAYDAFMKDVSLVTLSTIPAEQGQWAAKTALRILDGTPAKEIPLVKNKKGKLHLNLQLARLLGIKFPIDLLERSHLVSAEPQKLVFVNSYHKGYQWSDDIEKGFFKSIGIHENPDGTYDDSRSMIRVKVFRMDTKLNPSKAFKTQAGAAAKKLIDQWRPDIVVTSDDNAVEYLIAPYFRQGRLPFVFCGVNWDATIYNLPSSHITGMVEISPIRETLKLLRRFSAGDRVGIIGADNISNQKEMANHKDRLFIAYSKQRLVSDFNTWKEAYLDFQKTVDILILLSPTGIKNWDEIVALALIYENTKIPSGAISDSDAHYALLGKVRIAEEQGWWAGKTAMAILNGKPVSHIPVAKNEQSKLIINLALAKRLKIKFPLTLLDSATLIDEQGNLRD